MKAGANGNARGLPAVAGIKAARDTDAEPHRPICRRPRHRPEPPRCLGDCRPQADNRLLGDSPVHPCAKTAAVVASARITTATPYWAAPRSAWADCRQPRSALGPGAPEYVSFDPTARSKNPIESASFSASDATTAKNRMRPSRFPAPVPILCHRCADRSAGTGGPGRSMTELLPSEFSADGTLP